MKLSDNVKYVGVNDHNIDLFEGQYIVPNGMAYNSYVIIDEKIAVLDSVDGHFSEEWIANIRAELKDRTPDYLIVQHMEPDHSGSISKFMEEFPGAQIVSSQKAFIMMKNFYGDDYSDRQIAVKEGSQLELGSHKLTFIEAPMVHWPEVIMSYEESEKILFSADAFGKFGALDVDEEWACEARRYYVGIVGKYGSQVQKVLQKAKNLDIQTICPLHGPILTENLSYYVGLYDTWSSYSTETDGVTIAYTSVYGNTKKAVEMLAELLTEKGIKVAVNDLARCDMAEAVEDAFRYGKVVLATTTYNGNIFPFMREFISTLAEHNFQNKIVGFIENGSWFSTATKIMKDGLSKCAKLTFTEANVRILSAVNETNVEEIKMLAEELSK
ncbi:MAG: FprA family A-type flavoprotein [Clostridia bacterium]|nr:FprA family A-type flavoprotein [Clostridia bacterium]